MTVILRDYGHTKRSHCVKVIQTQSVAEHSHGVALFAAQLCGGKPSANLLLACLYHDLPECVTGDVPATAKWQNPKLAEALNDAEQDFMRDLDLSVCLTDEEGFILKLADLLDLGFYCVDELMYGNKHVESMYFNVKSALSRMTEDGKLPDTIAYNYYVIHNQMVMRADQALR